MAEPVEITADMVMEITPVRRDKAERIAAYATSRYAGSRPADAANAAGVGRHSGRSYERFLVVLRNRLGLPEPPTFDTRQQTWNDNQAAGKRGAHQLHHVQRGLKSATCPICQETTDE